MTCTQGLVEKSLADVTSGFSFATALDAPLPSVTSLPSCFFNIASVQPFSACIPAALAKPVATILWRAVSEVARELGEIVAAASTEATKTSTCHDAMCACAVLRAYPIISLLCSPEHRFSVLMIT